MREKYDDKRREQNAFLFNISVTNCLLCAGPELIEYWRESGMSAELVEHFELFEKKCGI